MVSVSAAAAASEPKESNSKSNHIEDEATKRNTDCVYFLASPLTCKKGSECEYRHSEYARMNPRDCYYWLNGSCLNRKCSFRHPPLDGLLGTQQPAPSNGSALPLPQPKTPSQVAVSQSKQVPCIFFQKGLCYKGDRCAFLHGPVPVAAKSPQVTVASQAAEGTSQKTLFGVPQTQRSAQESQVYQPNISKPVISTGTNSAPKVVNAMPKAKTGSERVVLQPGGFVDSSSSYIYTDTAPLSKSDFVSDDQVMLNGMDADDLYRESSPGFDVLVVDEHAEDEYYGDGQYGAAGRGLEGGIVNEYGAVPDADNKMFRDPQKYDGFDRMTGQYSRDQSRRSPERVSRGSASLEFRNNPRGSNSERTDHSDLRHRLEQKKGGGLRSGIRNDYNRDNHVKMSNDYRRDSRIVSPLDSSLNTRLHGRIRDTRRSPMRNSVSDIDNERRRNLSRTTPGRSQIRDRIGTKVHSDFTNERTLRGRGIIKEGLEDFSGPKKLSELKGEISVKNRLMSGRESFSLGKRKITDKHEQHDSDISFEGPKPLSEILKRKKLSKMNDAGSELLENKDNDATVSMTTDTSQDDPKSVTDASEQKTEQNNIQLSEVPNTDEVVHEEGMENMEAYDDGEEYYYEEDGGEYYYEEGENAEGEYVDEEPGDGAEKEMGEMQSS